MDQYIGKMLDNRYEILELIGSGGMANVYKAKCHRLNRMVAVKILKNDLAENADFLLTAKMDMVSLVDSLVAPLSLVNALIVAIGRKREGELAETFSKLERIWDEYEVYEKIEN